MNNKNSDTKSPTSNESKFNLNKIIAILVAVLAIGATLWISLSFIPYITDQTDEAKAVREQKESAEKIAREEKENNDKLSAEATNLKLGERNSFALNMKIKIADEESKDIKIEMNTAWAPQTVENFIRLSYRGYYNDMLFHRMVEENDFKVIQGGDPSGDGSGGETASGKSLPDELWEIKPEIGNDEVTKTSIIVNEPKFREPSLYADFDKKTGLATYRKGLILMAKTQSPDSATSQFFITLDKTILPAEYTVFGIIKDESFATLDYISSSADPKEDENNPNLTRPNKNIKIEKVEIL